ncbi:hypothetical protein [Dactylosporangium sp. CA-139066]|uniref:hypothetical protein n=1 Tax=Dactylosporangium sp. CA-139066 TaxID=3239930 RepID=UPI003D940E50
MARYAAQRDRRPQRLADRLRAVGGESPRCAPRVDPGQPDSLRRRRQQRPKVACFPGYYPHADPYPPFVLRRFSYFPRGRTAPTMADMPSAQMFRVHLKTAYLDLEIREVLQSPPSVLLGVTDAAEATLAQLAVGTVYDLALAGAFRDAIRLVEAAADPGTILARHGVPPSDLIVVPTPAPSLADLPGAAAATLVAVPDALGGALQTTMSVTSVRDLAQWPPYLAAVKILIEALAPGRSKRYDVDAPADLIARSGEFAAHQVRYTSTVLIESKPSSALQWHGGPIDVTSLDEAGFNGVAYGAVLRFTQSWAPRAVALGQLLHSLPLGPGESTRLTVVDWLRRVAASTEEDVAQAEQLSNALSNSTAISEVTRAVAREFQSGDSVATSASTTTSASTPGILSLLGGQASAGFSAGVAATYSTSTGIRSVSASALQSITARTQQNAALSRTRRAAIVSEVSESDSETINTRVVVNNNHMHAMSVQYYEVVQMWEATSRLERVERCIFIPMRLVNFRNEQVVRRYLNILIGAALDRSTQELLTRLRHTVVLEFAFERFATANLAQIQADADAPLPTADAAGLLAALAGAAEKRVRIRQLRDRIAAWRRGLAGDVAEAVRSRLLADADRTSQRWYEVDREAIIERISWDSAEIGGVTVQMVDGYTMVRTQPANRGLDAGSDQPSTTTPAEAIRLDRLASLQVRLLPANGAAASDYGLIRLWLLVNLRGRRRWVDIGFVASRGADTTVTLLQAHPPVDVRDVAARLMNAQLHYSQAIWMNADRQSLIMQLTPYACDVGGVDVRVVEWIDPVPITVAGNYVAFPFTYERDDAWKKWKQREQDESVPSVSLVPLPTGGVFAEAVLGEFNSAEKLDLTRFWKWQESPIPNLAPDIAPAQQGRQTRIGAPAVTGLPASPLSIQPPLALPATLGNSETLLKTLMVSKLFNDMSGIEITRGLLKASLEASRDGDAAVQKQANDTLNAITGAFGKLLQSGTDGGENLTKTAKGIGSLFNLNDKGDKKQPGGGIDPGIIPKNGQNQQWMANYAGSAIDIGTAVDGGTALDGLVAGGGADALASIGGEIGPILEALGPAAAALLA